MLVGIIKMVIYKCASETTKQPEMVSDADVECTLKEIMHISRAKEFANISVPCEAEAVTAKHANVPCRSEKYVP